MEKKTGPARKKVLKLSAEDKNKANEQNNNKNKITIINQFQDLKQLSFRNWKYVNKIA